MKNFYWKFPGDAYALGPTRAKNAAEARQQARLWAKVNRLPNGFQVWEA